VAERAGGALDVGGQGRVVEPVVGGVVADHVDDRRVRPHRVVQVGQAVGQAGAQVQQRRRRPVRHPRVAVGGTGDHTLEEAQHAAHAVDLVQGGHEVHLRRAGFAKQTSTPLAISVSNKLRAPFTRSPPQLDLDPT